MTDQAPNLGGSAASVINAASLPRAVDRATFQAELDRLRVREKAHTREGDALSLRRASRRGRTRSSSRTPGSTDHALEVEGEGLEEETEVIPPGASAELTVTLEAGTYELYCPVGIHKDQGMTIDIDVA